MKLVELLQKSVHIYRIPKYAKIRKKDKSDKNIPFRLRTLNIPGTLDQGKHWLMFQYHIYKVNSEFNRCFANVNSSLEKTFQQYGTVRGTM